MENRFIIKNMEELITAIRSFYPEHEWLSLDLTGLHVHKYKPFLFMKKQYISNLTAPILEGASVKIDWHLGFNLMEHYQGTPQLISLQAD